MSTKDIKLARRLLDLKLTEAKRLVEEMPEGELPELYWEEHPGDFESRESFEESAKETYEMYWEEVKRMINKEEREKRLEKALSSRAVLTVYDEEGNSESFKLDTRYGELVERGLISGNMISESLGYYKGKKLLDRVHEEFDFASREFCKIARGGNFLAVLVETSKTYEDDG